MVRFTDAMLGNQEKAGALRPIGKEEEKMRAFFMERVRMDPLFDGQNYIYMHYADMISNGYHRLAPCPFQSQGIMLNPNGDLFFCENSDVVGNVRDEGLRRDGAPWFVMPWAGAGRRPQMIAVRTEGDPLDYVSALKAAVHAADPDTLPARRRFVRGIVH